MSEVDPRRAGCCVIGCSDPTRPTLPFAGTSLRLCADCTADVSTPIRPLGPGRCSVAGCPSRTASPFGGTELRLCVNCCTHYIGSAWRVPAAADSGDSSSDDGDGDGDSDSEAYEGAGFYD